MNCYEGNAHLQRKVPKFFSAHVGRRHVEVGFVSKHGGASMPYFHQHDRIESGKLCQLAWSHV